MNLAIAHVFSILNKTWFKTYREVVQPKILFAGPSWLAQRNESASLPNTVAVSCSARLLDSSSAAQGKVTQDDRGFPSSSARFSLALILTDVVFISEIFISTG